MTVELLIEELLKIRDKSQKIVFFSVDAGLDEIDIFNFNSVSEIKYESEDLVILEFKDIN